MKLKHPLSYYWAIYVFAEAGNHAAIWLLRQNDKNLGFEEL